MSGTLRLRGSTSGYSELQAPAVAADQTFVLPTAGGTLLTTDSPVPQLTLQLGSASEPSLRFQGDLDTGLFSQGTNTLNLVTGGSSKVVLGPDAHTIYAGTNASVRALDIDSSGNVLVGLTSGAGKLQVAGGIRVAGSASHSDTSSPYIYRTSGADNLCISTSSTERMRIDSSGNVGIGTTSPEEILHVAAASEAVNSRDGVLLESESSLAADTGLPLVFTSHIGTQANYGVASIAGRKENATSGNAAGYLQFATGSSAGSISERMRINSSGNVGISVTDPEELLHVESGSSPTVYIKSSSASVDSFGRLEFANGTGATSAKSSIKSYRLATGNASTALAFETTNTSGTTSEAIRIDSQGNVLLRTTTDWANSKANNVVIGLNTSSSAAGISLGSTTECQIAFGDAGDSRAGLIHYQHSDNSMRFYTNGPTNERVRIDSSGRLLVGTTSAIDTGFTTGSIHLRDTYGGAVLLKRNDGTSGNSLGVLEFHSSFGRAALITAQNDGTHSGTSTPGLISFKTTPSGTFNSPAENLLVRANGLLQSPPTYSSTTSSAANVTINSSGYFQRSTSSAKYKTNVETLENSYSDALLNCRPVWYRSTCETDNTDWGWWGFIAEEVAEIDPRLVQWKTTEISHNDDGSIVETPCDPEPEGVAYDRFVPHLLNLIKRQQAAIETLKAKVAVLEAGN